MIQPAIKQMLEKYQCVSEQDYVNALKEIFQEIALLGLWRAKFNEYAAFYGESALRILYHLDRFSEDLDFTLLKVDKNFNLDPFNKAIADELNGFGLEVEVTKKLKNIESAFIKAGTEKQLIVIEAPKEITTRFHHMHTIKIKMEIDINPPGNFETEIKTLLQPIPFSVKTLTLPNLFAGKIHALLCRPWQLRVKGRDWYDFVWYIARNIPVNLKHLHTRLVQSQHFNESNLTQNNLINLLSDKINQTDFENTKKDILPFIKDKDSLNLWNPHFFNNLLTKIKIE